MKRKFVKYPVTAATKQVNLSSTDEETLNELVENMMYEVQDNYEYWEYSSDDLFDIVLEHIVMYISKLDDDEEYRAFKAIAKETNKRFCKLVRDMFDSHYCEYFE